MLYLLDSNILVYAEMDGMPEHKAASVWLTEALADGRSRILVTETSVLSFLRISTNKKVFKPPLTFDRAAFFVEKFLGHSNVQIFRPQPEHFIGVADFMKKHNFGGKLVMDAHLAVVAMSTGAVLVTRDGDFNNIPYLKTLDPIGPFSDEVPKRKRPA